MKVIPTINSMEWDEVKRNLELVREAGELVDWLHLDVSDGKFSEVKTLGLDVLGRDGLVKDGEFCWEAHLMVVEPIEYLDKCAELGVEMVLGHVEKMEDQVKFVDRCDELGIAPGLAIDGGSEIEMIDGEVWRWIERILVFGGEGVGPSGQVFQESACEKIERLVNIRKVGGYGFDIEVDGGVNEDSIEMIRKAGADVVSGNSAIYKNGEVEENIRSLS